MLRHLLAALAFGLAAGLSFDAADAKNRPVSKVITLLKDMLKQLEKEADQDEEIYDKMACWCETNDKEKTKAIADAERRIKELEVKIEEDTALSARLTAEIAKHKEEVATAEKALDEATAIRQKEIADFNAEEKGLLEAISALSSAVEVLSKHHATEEAKDGEAMLQIPPTRMNEIAMTLQKLMLVQADKLKGVLTPSQRRAASSFVQAPQDYFDATPTFKQSYAPQSGEIFGILRQMKEEFEKDLKDAQDKETQAQKAYEDLKAAKEAEIAAGKEQIATKTQEVADTDERLAHNKEDLDDTKSSLSADQQFLMMLKEKCSMTDKEWEERQKTRSMEMEAVSKALAILSGDDAHDLFTRTFNPAETASGAGTAFLQSRSKANSERRDAASKLLTDAAEKLHSPRLSSLAVRVRLDAFERVKKAIDDMIAALTQEKADEIKHKDFCTDELNENQLQTEKKERDKSDAETKIEELEMKIKKLAEEIEALKAEIAEMQVQLKRAGEDREAANKDFQLTIADQRETQKLLKAAMGVLEDFYGKQEAAAAASAFVQGKRQEPVGPPPPPGFKEYSKSAASGGVMQMIAQIVEDAKAMEKQALAAEQESQDAYESFVVETNASINKKAKEIVNKSEEKAKTEGELVKTKEILEEIMTELESLSNYNAQLHKSCDFVLKNFDLRQTARDEEIEALRQAKAILSGAKFSEFLQKE
jgi:chromosome segregation ATPase